MLKKITKWETEDGKVFDTQEEAEEYMFEQEKEVMTHTTKQERFEAWYEENIGDENKPVREVAFSARRAQVKPHSGGVSLDFTRVTDALPELVEFNPNNSGEWSSRLVFVLGANGHISFARLRIGGVNNKPETSELFQSADWQGDPRIIRRGVNRVRSGDVVAWAYSEKIQESALIAAAPQPPEASTVKLPSESAGWFKWDKISQCWHPQYSEYAETYAKVQGWQKLYTEQQVIGLIKSVDVTVKL